MFKKMIYSPRTYECRQKEIDEKLTFELKKFDTNMS